MKDICLGKNESGDDINLNLEKEGLRFILLLGSTGSGKSIFHNNLYKELSEKHTPEEVGFIFMDMTRVDFVGWNSSCIIKPVIVDAGEALDALENIKDEDRAVFIHIEECNMAYEDRARLEKSLDRIMKENKNIYVIYSTSRIDHSYLKDWMEKYPMLKVVFKVSSEEDSEFLLGNDTAFNFQKAGERFLIFNGKEIKSKPFSVTEETSLVDFKL